ncbi:MAG: ABC transporter ATP-binding protein [Opitutales bacterium]|jgi:ABC-type lipoprotein export system ATPase subunit|nr:ABC transporter ATP-binding protein [Opitutales bacterium]MDG2254772.1 ABC transporter ATP-binding protein [Opitutaceae bacterium]MBT5168964.1 ABC transporter ATP-binding protein [Opitutales bacterium]MBT5815443.1 ABC transporter ATP-binding protein [Opitutales bacterium]MBT6768463.1 ABC transporter ATP-binding protein [Opitutales bacterium]
MALLSLKNLSKRYLSDRGEWTEIVRISSFELDAGEQVLLQGESGSGKSTLLNVIAGIVAADEGAVTLDGTDMRALAESARDAHRARSLGYVFQNFNLLDAYSCIENVELGMAFGGKTDVALARKLLERVGLGERLNYRPDQLSQGQKQRVAIARALANRPKLVLADEPTGNLDPSNAAVALDLIQSLCRENGTALLLVSHDPSLKDRFERTIDLSELNEASSLLPGSEGLS